MARREKYIEDLVQINNRKKVGVTKLQKKLETHLSLRIINMLIAPAHQGCLPKEIK